MRCVCLFLLISVDILEHFTCILFPIYTSTKTQSSTDVFVVNCMGNISNESTYSVKIVCPSLSCVSAHAIVLCDHHTAHIRKRTKRNVRVGCWPLRGSECICHCIQSIPNEECSKIDQRHNVKEVEGR